MSLLCCCCAYMGSSYCYSKTKILPFETQMFHWINGLQWRLSSTKMKNPYLLLPGIVGICILSQIPLDLTRFQIWRSIVPSGIFPIETFLISVFLMCNIVPSISIMTLILCCHAKIQTLFSCIQLGSQWWTIRILIPGCGIDVPVIHLFCVVSFLL